MGLIKKKSKRIIRKPAKKVNKVSSKDIYETKIDEILKIVQDQEKITFEELSSDVGLSIEETESWLKILQKNGLVHLHYPMLTKPYTTTNKHLTVSEETQQDNKTRNLIIFGILSFIIMILVYYIFITK